ncbi:MAG: hypothetical protein M1114_05605 [Candidatus Dependentiae bacterium]|nr:hypothetical protein [Candidatus Dependentiae bacterium]
MKHLLLLACAMPLVAMENFEVSKAVIPTANKLSALSVINKNGRLDYSIADRSIQRCDIYGPLKEISSEEQLNGFLANGGRINVSQMSNGEYALRSGVDIKGGGYYTGKVFGWIVRGVEYGVPAYLAANKIKDISESSRNSENIFVRETANMSTEYIDSAINVGIPQTVMARNIVNTVGIENSTMVVTQMAITAQQTGWSYMTLIEWGATAAEAAGSAIWWLP